jgi:hypothetical protein
LKNVEGTLEGGCTRRIAPERSSITTGEQRLTRGNGTIAYIFEDDVADKKGVQGHRVSVCIRHAITLLSEAQITTPWYGAAALLRGNNQTKNFLVWFFIFFY